MNLFTGSWKSCTVSILFKTYVTLFHFKTNHKTELILLASSLSDQTDQPKPDVWLLHCFFWTSLMRVHVVSVFNLLNIVMQKSFERQQSMYYNSLSVLSTNLWSSMKLQLWGTVVTADSKTLIPMKYIRLPDSSESFFLWNRMTLRSCWLIIWSSLAAPACSLFTLIAELFVCFLNFKRMSETELDVCSVMDSALLPP